MSFKLWWCKHLTRRIEKYELKILNFKSLISTYELWIKGDKAKLKKAMKLLTKRENIQYGYDIGFIEEIDYQLMMEKLEEGEKNGR